VEADTVVVVDEIAAHKIQAGWDVHGSESPCMPQSKRMNPIEQRLAFLSGSNAGHRSIAGDFLLAHRSSLSEKVSTTAAKWIRMKLYVQESR
jgi:hypothetical protein